MKVTIVTPSFNQAEFIERTIESVLGQRGDFELQYLVIDGGSTDGTLSILDRYQARLRYVSEPDQGQSDAVNKGFRMANGDILAWLNSDDTYLPGAIAEATNALRSGHRWCVGRCRVIDENDREIRRPIAWYRNTRSRNCTVQRLLSQNVIAQPAVFFRRDLLEEVGPLDTSLDLAMDYDLWLRFARVTEPVYVPRELAAFRWRRKSKTGAGYTKGAWEAFRIASRHARNGERGAVGLHYVHYVTLVAAYRLLDLLDRLRRLGGGA